MTERLTEPLRRRHGELRPRLRLIREQAALVPELDADERRAVVADILHFLRGELRLHAEAEERYLYPEIALQLRHPLATAGMAFDHTLLREQAEALEAADADDAPALQAVLSGLYALLDAHFRKEEEVYLPFLEYEQEAPAVAAIEDAMRRHEHGEPQRARPPRIDLDELDFPDTGLPVEKLAYLLRFAVQAPSSHNAQPWLFRLTGEAVELLADRSRALPVVDPHDRALVMSCGAALFTLRAAIRHYGYEDVVALLPDEDEPDLLARVRLGDPRPPTRAERLIFWSIAARHTNRSSFENRELPQELVEELVGAAAAEGAVLRIVEDEEKRHHLAELVAQGDRRQFADPSFRGELAAWIHGGSRTRDGMPAQALEIPGPISRLAPHVVKTFDVGKSAAAHDRKLADESPVLAVLGTDRDSAREWLAAGQAVAHVLLRAAQDGVSGSFLNQPVEVAELRATVGRLAGVRAPQLVLRFGYGPGVKATPRRPLSDVVLMDEET